MDKVLSEMCPTPGFLTARLTNPTSSNRNAVVSKNPFIPTTTFANPKEIFPNQTTMQEYQTASLNQAQLIAKTKAAQGQPGQGTQTLANTIPPAPHPRSNIVGMAPSLNPTLIYNYYTVNAARQSTPLSQPILQKLQLSTLFHIVYHHPTSLHRMQALQELYKNRYWYFHRDLKVRMASRREEM